MGWAMRRREFLSVVVGAVAWPVATSAQQPEQVRRIGYLSAQTLSDLAPAVALFEKTLQQSGWTNGHNLRIDYRWSAGSPDNIRKNVTELVALAPDVIVVSGSAPVGPLLQATRTLPVVFINFPDPVGASLVDSLGRPGGNATGYINFEYSLSGKWLELLKEIAPRVTRVAVLRDATLAAGTGQWGAMQAVAPSRGVELTPVNMRDAAEIERSIAAFAGTPNGGMAVTQSALALAHRGLIVALAARHKLPAVYFNSSWAALGGLATYGADGDEQYRGAAGYVDRILRGAKPADLPVQATTRYELIVNLKTAKALGLEMPASVLTRADEVVD